MMRYVRQYKEALKKFNLLEELLGTGGDITVYYQRGIVFQLVGNHKKAKCDFKRAISLDPYYAKAWFSMGMSRLALYRENKSAYTSKEVKQSKLKKAIHDF
jgi:tetratricopeptide (TPR) repeat protein